MMEPAAFNENSSAIVFDAVDLLQILRINEVEVRTAIARYRSNGYKVILRAPPSFGAPMTRSLEALEGDLSRLAGVFDQIVFNGPQLPSHYLYLDDKVVTPGEFTTLGPALISKIVGMA